MASGGDDSNVALWSMSDGSQQALMSGHDGWVYSVSWSPNSCVLVSGGRDMSVRLWDVTTEESLLHSLEVYEHRKQHLDDHVLDFESTSVPAEANSVSVDDSSASSFLFGLGRKTLGTVTKTLGAVSFQLEDGRNALGAVTKKLGAVTDKLDDMFDDTMHMLGAKLGNRLDIIAELSETAHQKFEEAKFLAKNKATAAANKIQSAAANALDTLDDVARWLLDVTPDMPQNQTIEHVAPKLVSVPTIVEEVVEELPKWVTPEGVKQDSSNTVPIPTRICF